MHRLVTGALAAALAAGLAAAQALPYAYAPKVFVAVDAVSVQGNTVVVTGIVQGEQAPSTWAAYTYGSSSVDPGQWASSCHRTALLAMAKPGQYLLEIQSQGSYPAYCKLTRAVP
jgi:hypothetical protein